MKSQTLAPVSFIEGIKISFEQNNKLSGYRSSGALGLSLLFLTTPVFLKFSLVEDESFQSQELGKNQELGVNLFQEQTG